MAATIQHAPEQSWHWARLAWAAAALAAVPGAANAGFVQPTGVSAYRLMFVTSDPRDAADATFAPYDLFATTQANSAGDLPSATWLAVVSVGAVGAATHINCATCDPTVPIFMVDGTQVATSANTMFAGTFTNLPTETQTGAVHPFSYVWTGSNNDGTPDTGNTMDTTHPVVGSIGLAGAVFRGGGNGSTSDLYPIYAISDTIFAPVPEPATGFAVLSGGVAVTRILRRRRVDRRAA